MPETKADPIPDSEVTRALVIQAHPDDVDFGVAGTVAGWTARGTTVTYAICTDGQAGGFDAALSRERIPQIRRAEQTAAAKAVGVEDVRFLGYVDGELEVTSGLVRDLTRVIREVRPDRLVAPSAERNYAFLPVSHPDHLAAGEASVRAVYPASRNPFAFPELAAVGLEAWTVRELWLTGHSSSNHAVDITDTFGQKMTALHAHASQHPEPDQLEDRLRSGLGDAARRAGLPEGRLAETFAVFPCG